MHNASTETLNQSTSVQSLSIALETESRREQSTKPALLLLRNWAHSRCEKIFRRKTLYRRIPIIEWLPKYTGQDLMADCVAGITVGVTAIPQGLAYATVAGLPPQYGLYAAFVGCFVYAILGSTHAVTIGPTAILSLLTHEVTVQVGASGTVLLAFLSGWFALFCGLLNLGFLIDFISAPVVGGFCSAAAITIATSQIKAILGISFHAEGFVETWAAIFTHIQQTRLWDTVMGIGSIIILLLMRLLDKVQFGIEGHRPLWQRVVNRSLWVIATARNAVVILVCSLIAAGTVNWEPVPDGPLRLTGMIESGLPSLQLPPFEVVHNNQTYSFTETCGRIGSDLVIIPLLAILENIAIAKAFARGRKVEASQEMIAIGISNILGSFVSSYPVTGSFSRTAVNAASGVRTPMNGIFTGSLVLLATSVLTPYFYFIPKSSLAAVIITAVIFMVEVHAVKQIWHCNKMDLIPFGVTFLGCLFINLEYGILMGTGIHLAKLLYAVARPRLTKTIVRANGSEYVLVVPDRSLPFPSMDYFMGQVRKCVRQYPEVQQPLSIVVDLSHVPIIDFCTAMGFKVLASDLKQQGSKLVLRNASPEVLRVLLSAHEEHNIFREAAEVNNEMNTRT